jgi:hypothetical protein
MTWACFKNVWRENPKEHSEHETERKKTYKVDQHQDRNNRLGMMSHGRKLK